MRGMLRNWTNMMANQWKRASLTIFSVTITDYGNARTLHYIYLDLFVCHFSAVRTTICPVTMTIMQTNAWIVVTLRQSGANELFQCSINNNYAH